MRVLLDTQCWLWWFVDPGRLNRRARELIGDASNEILFSAASAWEIAIKSALGKLTLPESPAAWVSTRVASQGMIPLSIRLDHALAVSELPPLHRDPFDRLLVAQCRIEEVPILTADSRLGAYGVEWIWAGKGKRPRPA